MSHACRKISMSLPYQYTDLAEDEIRLVDVISGSDPAELRCLLQHVSVHEKNLDYVALSYTWQDPTVGLSQATETKCSILIDGHPLPILSNLAVALVELRARSTGPVWVDAICMYPDRHRTKCCRNLRCEPLFCEEVGFTRLTCRFLEPERALITLRLSPLFTHMSLFRLLRAGSGWFTTRSPIAILSHSLARLERIHSNLLSKGGQRS
jgi:hypothetical protein